MGVVACILAVDDVSSARLEDVVCQLNAPFTYSNPIYIRIWIYVCLSDDVYGSTVQTAERVFPIDLGAVCLLPIVRGFSFRRTIP